MLGHFLATPVDITWQLLSIVFTVIAGAFAACCYGIFKFTQYLNIKATATKDTEKATEEKAEQARVHQIVLLEEAARGWENLYKIEVEANRQLSRQIQDMRNEVAAMAIKLQTLQASQEHENTQHQEALDLNIKHQQTISKLNHEKGGLEHAIALIKKENDLLRAQANAHIKPELEQP